MKAPSLEARLCEFLPGRSSDPEGQAPGGGKLVSHPGRRLPAGRPAALARPARPSSGVSVSPRDERPVRPSSLLDLTLAQRVAVQAPHPRRPASHDGERPPTARPPLGGPAVSDLDTTRRRTPSRSPRLPEGARRRPRPGGVLCRPSGPGSARAPGPGKRAGWQAVARFRARCLHDESPRGRPPEPGPHRRGAPPPRDPRPPRARGGTFRRYSHIARESISWTPPPRGGSKKWPRSPAPPIDALSAP